ncbi:Vms1/Ankzf1 family peptidyl-tRNA hydrolase [Microbacterium sp. STN6]|uniref:baeRF2 domain-containing protein n=1 Tax=Microbacterium sp. STN6 TaxID=2995588 RepID=UPI002260C3CB|nr:Vms1/Ankzf1 family peptidyl-tRNA hydrolase [Microbacterium sp. STN6]MCX7523447.1 Vms1/Ankzf1 family peptidyl-tRNA hydrolase [Microbacterium sp. STN6]
MAAHSADETTLSELLRSGGNWSQVYLDVSLDVEDPPQRSHLQWRTMRDGLVDAGAPGEDVAAIEAVLAETPGVGSPVSRYILAKNGEIVLSEVLPGPQVQDNTIGYGPVPDLVPLVRHRRALSPYMIVEAGRDGGRIRVYGTRGPDAVVDTTTVGRGDSLNKVQAGGWSNPRYQHHTEEIWKQNEAELADEVNALVLVHRPRLLLLAGDVRAVQLLEGELSAASRDILSTVSTYTRPAGASDHELRSQLAAELATLADDERRRALDRLGVQEGDEGSGAQVGVGAVVHALQQGQVDTLLLDVQALGDRHLLAFDAEPWLASVPEESLGATILDKVAAPVALVRAALLTDADIVFTDARDLPEKSEVAAVLRWPAGPPVPGT